MADQAIDRDDVIRKIQKLMNVTVENGASAGTEEAHQKKARELMDKYQLSMTDIAARKYHEGIYKHPLFQRDEKGRPPMWAFDFVNAISRAFDCTAITLGGFRLSSGVSIVGHDSDIKLCSFMVDSLSRTLLPKAKEAAAAALRRRMDVHRHHVFSTGEKAAFSRKFIVAFMIGAAARIRDRLLAAKAKVVTPEAGALVVIKKEQVDLWLQQEMPEVKDNTGPPPPDKEGRAQGARAGSLVSLNRPLENGVPPVPVSNQLALN